MTRTFLRSAVLACCASFALIGCAATEGPRYLLAPPAGATQTQVAVRTVEMRRITLPAYAAGSAILTSGADGALVATSGQWADDPESGFTAALAATVEARSSARVAVEPWPLAQGPDARVEVRLDRMVPNAAGLFELSGQIAVTAPEGQLSDRLRRVALSVPIAGTGPSAIAAAQSQAIAGLADQIVLALR